MFILSLFHVRYFESLIGALLETYYKVDRNMAEMVLRKQILVWNGKNLIEVAGEIGLKSFFSQQACQSILEKDWNKVIMNQIFKE